MIFDKIHFECNLTVIFRLILNRSQELCCVCRGFDGAEYDNIGVIGQKKQY